MKSAVVACDALYASFRTKSFILLFTSVSLMICVFSLPMFERGIIVFHYANYKADFRLGQGEYYMNGEHLMVPEINKVLKKQKDGACQ